MSRKQVWGIIAHVLFLLGVLVMAAHVAKAQRVTPPAVFETPISAVTAITTSVPVRQIGQAQHLIKVETPAGTVTNIQVRIEASYGPSPTCGTAGFWFPISADLTQTFSLLDGPHFYSMVTGFGVYPCVRVRSLKVASSAMTVRYFGQIVPGSSASKQVDRYVF